MGPFEPGGWRRINLPDANLSSAAANDIVEVVGRSAETTSNGVFPNNVFRVGVISAEPAVGTI